MRRELDGGYEIDDDRQRIDAEAVHAFISGESYWGRGRPRELVEQTVSGSLRVVGVYLAGEQVGFARAVSDGATVAYLADVYILAEHRGRGLGAELVREMVDGGELANIHWLLHTADARGLYARFGFLDGPVRYPLMERAHGYDASP